VKGDTNLPYNNRNVYILRQGVVRRSASPKHARTHGKEG